MFTDRGSAAVSHCRSTADPGHYARRRDRSQIGIRDPHDGLTILGLWISQHIFDIKDLGIGHICLTQDVFNLNKVVAGKPLRDPLVNHLDMTTPPRIGFKARVG